MVVLTHFNTKTIQPLEHKTKGIMSIKKVQNENTKAARQTVENFWAGA
jgi:hypothetical protein